MALVLVALLAALFIVDVALLAYLLTRRRWGELIGVASGLVGGGFLCWWVAGLALSPRLAVTLATPTPTDAGRGFMVGTTVISATFLAMDAALIGGLLMGFVGLGLAAFLQRRTRAGSAAARTVDAP